MMIMIMKRRIWPSFKKAFLVDKKRLPDRGLFLSFKME